MRRRSLTAPLLLLIVGSLFLWSNLHPETRVLDLVALYWPLLLIVWGIMRAVEVVFWRREGYRTGLSGGEIVLIVFVCLIGSGISQAHRRGFNTQFFHVFGEEIWGQQYDYPVSLNASAAGMKTLVIEGGRGNVKITGADTQQVVVTGRKLIRAMTQQDAERTNGVTRVEIVPQGDRLVVRTNQERASQNQRVSDDLEIVVPRELVIEGRSNWGDYEVSDIAANVSITSGNADVRLARIGGNARLELDRSALVRAGDIKGDVNIRCEGSDLDLENISGLVTISGGFRGTVDFKNLAKPLQYDGSNGTELRAQAVPGHISMDLGQFTGTNLVGPVRLVARSRDVRLDQFTQSLELETQRGDVELAPGRVPLPAIDVRAGTGRIDLELPAAATFNLEATAQVGDAVNDFGSAIRKEVSGRSATLSGKVGAGPNVRLTAGRGWISVRKEGAPRSTPPEAGDSGETPEPKGSRI